MILVGQMFISSPSHGFAHGLLGHFLFVCPSVFVSRHVSRSVDYVLSSRLALPTAGGVESLLVRSRELGGVREAAHCRGSHCPLREHHLSFNTTVQFYPTHHWSTTLVSLTVTPEIMGDFPSTSLKISASASSTLFSLYFFLASSASAVLNSSYVMLRQDFFLKCEWKGRLITQQKHLQPSLTCLGVISGSRGSKAQRVHHVIASAWERVSHWDKQGEHNPTGRSLCVHAHLWAVYVTVMHVMEVMHHATRTLVFSIPDRVLLLSWNCDLWHLTGCHHQSLSGSECSSRLIGPVPVSLLSA